MSASCTRGGGSTARGCWRCLETPGMGPPPPCLNLGKLLDRTSIPDQRPGGDRTARAVLSCLASSSGAVEAGATAEFDARLTTFDVPIADATDVARLVSPSAFTMLATVNKRRG